MDSDQTIIAAIDMGSNSFHMVIARVIQGEIRVLTKMAEKVQLGAALNKQNRLPVAAQKKALSCLSRFAQRLENFPQAQLRVVGTNALRAAKNADEFIEKAEKLLNKSIEIISGREEARLIYLGVSHTLSDDSGQRLVIDIGGGSTELIIGQRFESQVLESLHMGCVSYAKKFFPEGVLSKKAFEQAVLAARQEIFAVEAHYKKIGWQQVVGSSGTVHAIAEIVEQNGWSQQGITLGALNKLFKYLLSHKNVEQLKLDGLKEDRRFILPAGVAILLALFQQLGLSRMRFSEGALREGVLYDLLGRYQHEDVRDRTTQALMKRYAVEQEQAERVAQTALTIWQQVKNPWGLQAGVFKDMLMRAACLHELGLAVAHSAFHKHGAYLIYYSDLPGFSRLEQQVMSAMVRCHRRKIALEIFEDLPASWQKPALLLTLILRWAVIFQHARKSTPLPDLKITAKNQKISLSIGNRWLSANPLIAADLEQEKNYLAMIGVFLEVG